MTAAFPLTVWDRGSADRTDLNKRTAPSGSDWLKLVEEIKAMQKFCDAIGLGLDGTFADADPSKTSQLYRDTGSGVNEVQQLAQIASTSGTWTLTITLPGNDAVTTAALQFDANAAEIETAIDTALDGLSVNGVAFAAGDISAAGASDINAGNITLTFDGTSVAGMNIAQCSTTDVDLDDNTPPVVSTTTPGVVDNVLTLSGAGTATYPNVWDGTSETRTDTTVARAPDEADWREVVKHIKVLQERIQPLGIEADGTIPTSGDDLGLWANGNQIAVFGAATTDVWDGTSDSRPNADVRRAPDWQDYNEALSHVLDLQNRIVPLGFTALGVLPTSDPAEAGKLYTSSGVLTVSV